MIVLALSQVDGAENDAALHVSVRRALQMGVAKLLEQRQHASVQEMPWIVLALRCAESAGGRVPAGVLKELPGPGSVEALLEILTSAGGDGQTHGRDQLLARQNPDGAFPAPAGQEAAGRIWPTAVALIELSLPLRALPLSPG